MRKKQDIEPKNDSGELHGLCIGYYNNGNVEYKVRLVNGILHGIREWHWGDGELKYKSYDKKGKDVYHELYVTSNRIRFDI